MVDTLLTQGNEAKQYYERKMLYRAQQSQIIYDLGQTSELPQNSGNSVSWRKINALSLATNPTSEGITPTASVMQIIEVTGTVNQYGNYVGISDMMDLMAIDKIRTEAVALLGQNGGESIDAVCRAVLVSGLNVLYATGTNRASVGASNVMSLELLRQAIATLQTNNAQTFSGNNSSGLGKNLDLSGFVLVVHPNVGMDIVRDPEIKNYMQYAGQNTTMTTGKIGSIMGNDIMRSTINTPFVGQGLSGANVYPSFLIAKNAFGVVDVAGRGKYDMVDKPFGYGEDPLNQRAAIGWKALQLPIILNNNFMVRIETGATNG